MTEKTRTHPKANVNAMSRYLQNIYIINSLLKENKFVIVPDFVSRCHDGGCVTGDGDT